MKLKDLYKKHFGYTPIMRFRVRSKSRPSEYHLVEVFKDGKMTCDCVANYFGVLECEHKKIVKKRIEDAKRKKQKKGI